MVVPGEVLFWLCTVIAGRDIVKKYRKYLNPFSLFKKNASKEPSDTGDK